MIRLLADENFPRLAVARLRQAGFDVAVVASGATDHEVLAHAQREDRVLVTLDRDFGRLAFATRSTRVPGIVYLRLPARGPRAHAEVLLGLLRSADLQLEGYFTTVRGAHVRQRPLGRLQ